uniref:NELL2-interacting cell ontogeny regulator 1 n=1 Tax=Gadus morhua TaxID=8049 RepID=A0A8C5C346_GADMO
MRAFRPVQYNSTLPFSTGPVFHKIPIVILAMASTGYYQTVVILLAAQLLLCYGATDADQDTGTVIPAESRPCVDCHAFEFMQRALQDLKKTAFNLDARVRIMHQQYNPIPLLH